MEIIRYRVKNMCHYDIGVKNVDNRDIPINAGSFQMMTADDIAYTESISTIKPFSKRMLVVFDNAGNELSLDGLGLYEDDSLAKHLTDEDIEAALKQTTKKLESWLANIDDITELHAIAEVARNMDLPASKLKILTAKMPNSDFVEPDAE